MVGFDCTESRLFDARSQNLQRTETVCNNCGKNHKFFKCIFPLYTVHCTGCLVVSLNGAHHISPCQRLNKISLIRSNVFAENGKNLFDLTYENDDLNLFYLKDGTFRDVHPNLELVSTPAESFIIFNAMENKKRQMTFFQSSFKRCSIIIAVRDLNNKWRLRFRAVDGIPSPFNDGVFHWWKIGNSVIN